MVAWRPHEDSPLFGINEISTLPGRPGSRDIQAHSRGCVPTASPNFRPGWPIDFQIGFCRCQFKEIMHTLQASLKLNDPQLINITLLDLHPVVVFRLSKRQSLTIHFHQKALLSWIVFLRVCFPCAPIWPLWEMEHSDTAMQLCTPRWTWKA